jgi:hypothetical protein
VTAAGVSSDQVRDRRRPIEQPESRQCSAKEGNQGIIHDFVMLDALRGTHAAQAAITQAAGFLRAALAAR